MVPDDAMRNADGGPETGGRGGEACDGSGNGIEAGISTPDAGGSAGDAADALPGMDGEPDGVADAGPGADVMPGETSDADASDAESEDGPSQDGVSSDGNDGGTDATDGGPGGVDGPTDGGSKQGDPDVPPTVIIAATTSHGGLWLFSLPSGSIVGPADNPKPPIDVLESAGSLGFIDDVEVQSVGPDIYILGRTGTDVHIARLHGAAWTSWRPVASEVRAMSLANLEGAVWACLVGTDKRLRLASQRDDGGWQDYGDVMDQASIPSGESPAGFVKVDCAGVGSDLEVFGIDLGGHLWHATKAAAGWIPFRLMTEGGSMNFLDVDAANAAGDLYVLASTTATQFHEGRPAGGAWTGFADLEWNVGDPMGSVVAGAQAALLTELALLELNSRGEIWLTSRFRIGLSPYQRLVSAAPDGYPFASLSATGLLPY